MSSSNDKYLVIKRSDFTELRQRVQANADMRAALGFVLDLDLPGSEVIRKQDITSAPIFHHYSSQIHLLIELVDLFNVPINRERLREIADYFHAAALDAEQWPTKKVPD